MPLPWREKATKSMPCSSRIKRLVHKIRLKPMKKKIVGGSACRICTSHQSKARRRNDTGAEMETLGWLTPYLPKHRAESPARLCATFIKPTWCSSTPAPSGARALSRRGSARYRSGRSPEGLKMKNPAAAAVKRDAEEDSTT